MKVSSKTINKVERALIINAVMRQDDEKIRFRQDGRVLIKGPYPNAIDCGWRFAGWAGDIMGQLESLEGEDA